jgi:hypothetical protein
MKMPQMSDAVQADLLNMETARHRHPPCNINAPDLARCVMLFSVNSALLQQGAGCEVFICPACKGSVDMQEDPLLKNLLSDLNARTEPVIHFDANHKCVQCGVRVNDSKQVWLFLFMLLLEHQRDSNFFHAKKGGTGRICRQRCRRHYDRDRRSEGRCRVG